LPSIRVSTASGRTSLLRCVSCRPGGAVRAFEFHGNPGLIRLDPSWHQAAFALRSRRASGTSSKVTDHLLFLLCLVIPFRRLRPLVIIVTSFTVGHSISLAASAFGFVPDALWFPPLIETLIAITIRLHGAGEHRLCRARGNQVPTCRGAGSSPSRSASCTGSASPLRCGNRCSSPATTSSPRSPPSTSASEIGQIAVLLVLVPALALLFKYVLPEWLGIIILSALVVHTGWHWMIERGDQLAKFPFPKLDAAFLASVMRGLMAALILAGRCGWRMACSGAGFRTAGSSPSPS